MMEKFTADEAKKLAQSVIDERCTKRNVEDLKMVYSRIKEAASNGHKSVTIDKSLDKWVICELRADGYRVDYDIDASDFLFYGIWKNVKTIILWG